MLYLCGLLVEGRFYVSHMVHFEVFSVMDARLCEIDRTLFSTKDLYIHESH